MEESNIENLSSQFREEGEKQQKMTHPELDIIVITHGHLELSMHCVNAFYQNSTLPFHMIVMDDSTPDMDEGTDLTPEWFERFCRAHDNIDFIHSDTPHKTSISLINKAFDYCQTSYVVLSVNSNAPEPEWDAAGFQMMRRDPKIGVIGFKSLRAGTELIESAGLALSVDGSTLTDIGRGQPGQRLSKAYECDAVQWAFVLMRKEAVMGNLGADVYNGWKGWEDFESCFSVRSKGWQVWYCGLGTGYHKTLATRQATCFNDIALNLQNREIFAKRWGLWAKYHALYPQVGESFPDMEIRGGLSPVLLVDPTGVLYSKPVMAKSEPLDIKEGLSESEEVALTSLASAVTTPNATFVEAGSWKGHSASIIGKVVKQNGGRLYCIDHWQGNEGTKNVDRAQDKDIQAIFEHNMKTLELWDYITAIKSDSVTASAQFDNNSIDFLFLDADHRYQPFMDELKAWYPKLKAGATICGHDCEGYFSGAPQDIQDRIVCCLEEDYINNAYHPGIIKGLHDFFRDDYSLIQDTRIWFKKVVRDTNHCGIHPGIANFRKLAKSN